jgi:hypothetical protein
MAAMYLTDVAWIFLCYKSVTFHSGGCSQNRSAALTEFEVAGQNSKAVGQERRGKQGGRAQTAISLGPEALPIAFHAGD